MCTAVNVKTYISGSYVPTFPYLSHGNTVCRRAFSTLLDNFINLHRYSSITPASLVDSPYF